MEAAVHADTRKLPETRSPRVLTPKVIGVDQAGWPNLQKKGGRPWQLWCITTQDAVYHRICDDKSAAIFVELLGAYEGHIVCDARATHGAGAREGPGITLAGCWATCIGASPKPNRTSPRRAALDWIGALYEIDARACPLKNEPRRGPANRARCSTRYATG